MDSIMTNAWSGMGIPGVDISRDNVREPVHLTSWAAKAEYRDSWQGQAEIDRPAEDMVSEGFEFIDTPGWFPSDSVMSYLDSWGTGAAPEDRGLLRRLARLFAEGNKLGGAAGILIIDDGLESWEPVDPSRIREVRDLLILEKEEITPHRPPDGGPVEFYAIGSERAGEVGHASLVHRSRVILARGKRLGPREEYYMDDWGVSTLEASLPARRASEIANQELGTLAQRAVQDVLYLGELGELLCDNEGGAGSAGRAALQAKVGAISRARSQHKLAPLDAGRNANPASQVAGRPSDRLETLARPVRGHEAIAAKTDSYWAASSGQPPSIALGITVGGLGNDGKNLGEWQAWGSKIAAIQDRWLRPRLRYILTLIFASTLGPTRGRVPAKWAIKFISLWTPTADEEAATAKAWAEVDTIYLAMAGPALARVILEQRFVHGAKGMISLDALPEEEPPPPPPPPPPAEDEDGEELELEAPEEDIEDPDRADAKPRRRWFARWVRR
jgi:hypothetical protein